MYPALLSECRSLDWLLLRLLSQKLGNNPDGIELSLNFRVTSEDAKAYKSKTGGVFHAKVWQDIDVEVRLS
jgi:hypothetical protein